MVSPDLKPYWGNPAVRNFRGADGNGGIAVVSPEVLGTFRYDMNPHHYDARCAIGPLDRHPEPYAVEYAIQRRYCRRCMKLVEGCVPDALPGCTIDLQTMLVKYQELPNW